MTVEEWNEIFSKEYLSIADIQKLFGFQYDKAAEYIRTIKRALTYSKKYGQQGVRLEANGKLHIQDYLDYNRILNQDRYVFMPNTHEKDLAM